MKEEMSKALSLGDQTPVILSSEGKVKITSIELVQVINTFRKEEGNETIREHSDLMKSIRAEIKVLEDAGIAQGNFSPGSYMDKNNQERPCYELTKAGALQMLNKESAVVRYKTVQYIEKLEKKSVPQTTEEIIIYNLQEQQKIKQQLNQVNHNALAAKAQSQEVKQEVADLKDSMPLFKVECDELTSMVKKKATYILGGYKSSAYNDKSILQRVYKDIYAQISREFGVDKCSGIKRKDFEIAKKFVGNYIAPMALAQDINLANSQATLFDDKG